MKIALYGIGGLYNYGCEAIVRGTVAIIRKAIPNAHITYYSMRADEDKIKVADLDIDVVALKKGYSFGARVINHLLRKLNIAYRVGEKSFKQIVDFSDVIISIGGDIYTIPEYIRNQERYPYYKKLVQFGEYALQKGKILIIFGASIGPFGLYKKAQRYYFKHFSKVSLIVAREQRCIQYLNENAIENNVCFMPDPAFAVSLDKTYDDNKPQYIGINLSALSVKEIYGDVTDDMLLKLAKKIEDIIRLTRLNVLLIPHVLSPVNEEDNDLIFLKRLYNLLDEDMKAKAKICEPYSFLDAKKILRKCRILVASRMHCAINGVSESVPTLFLSYSEKAKGMVRFVYGDDRFLLTLQDVNSKLPSRVIQMLDQEEHIRKYLDARISQIREIMFQDTSIKRIIEVIKGNA